LYELKRIQELENQRLLDEAAALLAKEIAEKNEESVSNFTVSLVNLFRRF